MELILTKYRVNTPIERVRGLEEIPIVVYCTFENSGKEYEASGVVLCKDLCLVDKSIEEAINRAKGSATKYFSSSKPTTQSKETNSNPEKMVDLIKNSLSGKVSQELRKVKSREVYDQMLDLAKDDKQNTVKQLCEALGIDNIVIDKWTNVEALSLISTMEQMTEPLSESL